MRFLLAIKLVSVLFAGLTAFCAYALWDTYRHGYLALALAFAFMVYISGYFCWLLWNIPEPL